MSKSEKAIAELAARIERVLHQETYEIRHQMDLRFDRVSEQLAALVERDAELRHQLDLRLDAVSEQVEALAPLLEQGADIRRQLDVRFDHVSEQLAALLERGVEQDDRLRRDLARIERDLATSRELVVEFAAHLSRMVRDLRDGGPDAS
ncbi:MAG TPA: hypothetical protein VD790_02295 [Thermoleophilaceae bacterium]|nr:hypothetical protein [Thermoleophilaceae bacterium]